MRKIFLAIVLLCISHQINAQNSDRKWNLGLYGGATQYNGDMGQGFYKTNQPFYGFGAISVGYYLGKYADLQIMGTTGDSTGVHLHFEVHENGGLVDPLNYIGG